VGRIYEICRIVDVIFEVFFRNLGLFNRLTIPIDSKTT